MIRLHEAAIWMKVLLYHSMHNLEVLITSFSHLPTMIDREHLLYSSCVPRSCMKRENHEERLFRPVKAPFLISSQSLDTNGNESTLTMWNEELQT